MKSLQSSMLLLIACGLVSLPTSVAAGQKGDVTGDGCINVFDALIALKISVNIKPPTPEADVYPVGNEDGVVNVFDALFILKASAEMKDLGTPACSCLPDCAIKTCQPAEEMLCDVAVDGNNGDVGHTKLIDSYSCNNYSYESPEYAYEFHPLADVEVTVSLSNEGAETDILVLQDAGGGCQPKECVDWDFSSVTFDALAAQTYYFVVDGYSGAVQSGTGDFTISVECGCVSGEVKNTVCSSFVGECEEGLKSSTCINGDWGPWGECWGGVEPVDEVCDGLDNDCDGVVDNMATCPQGQSCQQGECVADCQPKTCDQLGMECDSWSDGCDGSVNCGGCPGGKSCQGGKCVCQPACAGKECGPDGCGNTCGSCPYQNSYCDGSGQCQCSPSCGGNQCGGNGCGGVCGECNCDETCQNGNCSVPCLPHTAKKCVDGDVYWFDSCGTKQDKATECGSSDCADFHCKEIDGNCTPDSGFQTCWQASHGDANPKLQTDITTLNTFAVVDGTWVVVGEYNVRVKCNGKAYKNSNSCSEGGCNGEYLGNGGTFDIVGASSFAASLPEQNFTCLVSKNGWWGWLHTNWSGWDIPVVSCGFDSDCGNGSECFDLGPMSGWSCNACQDDCSSICSGKCGSYQGCSCGGCSSGYDCTNNTCQKNCNSICSGKCGSYQGCSCGGCSSGYDCTNNTCQKNCNSICSGKCGSYQGCSCGGCSSGYDCTNNTCQKNCSSICSGKCGSYQGCSCGGCNSGYDCTNNTCQKNCNSICSGKCGSYQGCSCGGCSTCGMCLSNNTCYYGNDWDPDKYENNNSAPGYDLGKINDCNSIWWDGVPLSASIYPQGDVDVYKYHIEDSVCQMYPAAELEPGLNFVTKNAMKMKIGLYFVCDSGSLSLTCKSGIKGSWSNKTGCESFVTSDSSAFVKLDPSCDNFWGDDSGTAYVVVYSSESSGYNCKDQYYELRWGDD